MVPSVVLFSSVSSLYQSGRVSVCSLGEILDCLNCGQSPCHEINFSSFQPLRALWVHAAPGVRAPPEGVNGFSMAIIDLSKTSTREGRAELAIKARDAMREQGFFYVINHGYTQEQVS